ncbi:MAG: NUMOD4 domain-containing protein [bacterium]|nr:NUMOD4 domain-containing protein [bacterium]
MENDTEIWKPISGYEDFYLVSNMGRIWSVRSGRALKLPVSKTGYCRTHLSVDGIVKIYSVHRLVAQAFIPNPQNKPTVNHINENKQDNRVENLEWATYHEQNIHGTRTERVRKSTDYKARSIDYAVVASKHNYYEINKEQMKPVLQFDKYGNFIARHEGVASAARNVGICASHICCCLKGRRKSSGGYKWKYA